MINTVIDEEEQTRLTPNEVITDLLEGNARFRNQSFLNRNYESQIEDAQKGQNPKAIILACIDSRVPVETIFDQGIGDLFVARVAGNIENEDIIASLEYACKVAGSKLILVLGHEDCGAVKAACDGIELGNITELLNRIKPVIDQCRIEHDRNSGNKTFVDEVIDRNVSYTMDQIRLKSPILVEMEKQSEILIKGAVYQLSDGQVKMLDN
jgi:carbonic anhydrase